MASLLKSTGVVGSMTLASRVLGFVRDVMNAALFGVGFGMDAFIIAFLIPNLMRRLFAEGAFSQAFVPVFTQTRTQGGLEDQRRLISAVSGTLGGVLLVLTLLGLAGAPVILMLFAPGFGEDPVQQAFGVELLRITFPYMMLISLTAMVAGVLNSHGRFALPAFTPVLLNVCMIVAALIDSSSVRTLAWAVLVGGFLQLGFQLPMLFRLGLGVRPRWAWREPEVQRIILLMLPIMFGASIGQISVLLNNAVASLIPGDGSVSWLYFADRVMEFPLGIFSVAIATVILPSLSVEHAQRSPERFSAMLDWGLRLLLLIALPAMLGLWLLAGPLVTTLFQYARFTVADVQMTAPALIAYAFAFLGLSLAKVLLTGFYARQQTRQPVRYGVIALSVGMVISVVLTWTLVRHQYFAPHVALAVATSVSAFINAGLLYLRLRRDGVYRAQPGWRAYGARLLLACVVMSWLLLQFSGDLSIWLALDAAGRALRLLLLVAAAAASYFFVLAATGLRPHHLRHSV